MNRKQRFKLELYQVLLNTHPGKVTDNEAALLHYLAVDEDVQDALTKRAQRDYQAMTRRWKRTYKNAERLIPDAAKLIKPITTGTALAIVSKQGQEFMRKNRPPLTFDMIKRAVVKVLKQPQPESVNLRPDGAIQYVYKNGRKSKWYLKSEMGTLWRQPVRFRRNVKKTI